MRYVLVFVVNCSEYREEFQDFSDAHRAAINTIRTESRIDGAPEILGVWQGKVATRWVVSMIDGIARPQGKNPWTIQGAE